MAIRFWRCTKLPLKEKVKPDLPSVCSNYWPPIVASVCVLTIWNFRPFGNAAQVCNPPEICQAHSQYPPHSTGPHSTVPLEKTPRQEMFDFVEPLQSSWLYNIQQEVIQRLVKVRLIDTGAEKLPQYDLEWYILTLDTLARWYLPSVLGFRFWQAQVFWITHRYIS